MTQHFDCGANAQRTDKMDTSSDIDYLLLFVAKFLLYACQRRCLMKTLMKISTRVFRIFPVTGFHETGLSWPWGPVLMGDRLSFASLCRPCSQSANNQVYTRRVHHVELRYHNHLFYSWKDFSAIIQQVGYELRSNVFYDNKYLNLSNMLYNRS